MIKPEPNKLNEFLEGYKPEITCIYGPAATGKTTMGLLATVELAKEGKKVIFLDTENGFSVDRIKQIAGWNYISILDKILLLKAKDFEDQIKKIKMLPQFVDIDLVVIDSINNFYRKEIHNNTEEVNDKLVEQIKILNNLTKKGTKVILTSQVYSKFDEKEVKFLGGKILQNFSRKIIELQKDPRKIIIQKPYKKESMFDIIDSGLILLP